jgi:hypothetical protein
MSILNMFPTYADGEPINLADWVKVFVPRLGVWHHGIVRRIYPVWNGFAVEIAHNMKQTGVTVSDWYVFADGNMVVLHRHAESKEHVREILERVEANLGKLYHLFAQNCEHFACFAFTGKAESKSIQIVGWVAAGVFAVALFGK